MSKGEDTRNRIIQPTATLFNKHQLASVPVSDIMQATDLQKGGIYNPFNSKEDVALAAFDYNNQQISQIQHQQPTNYHRLNPFLDNYVAALTRLDSGYPVLNADVEYDTDNQSRRKRAQHWHRTLANRSQNGELAVDFHPNANRNTLSSHARGRYYIQPPA